MFPYVLVFLAALAVDTIPVFAPPAWIVLVILVVKFKLEPWVVVLIGVFGSTLGRYILSLYIPKVSSSIINHREDKNLRYIGKRIIGAGWAAATFIFLYTLTPLSTTVLFTATGIARVNPWRVLPPFFCGRIITDAVMVWSGKYAAGNVSGLFKGQVSIKAIIILVIGLVAIGAFLFIDWRNLLEKRQLRFNFKILKDKIRKPKILISKHPTKRKMKP